MNLENLPHGDTTLARISQHGKRASALHRQFSKNLSTSEENNVAVAVFLNMVAEVITPIMYMFWATLLRYCIMCVCAIGVGLSLCVCVVCVCCVFCVVCLCVQ